MILKVLNLQCNYGPEKACKIEADNLKAILRIFPVYIECSITQTCKQKKAEYVADFEAGLKLPIAFWFLCNR